jgi:dTDP-4-amino-4,6-dideoxygalactose transaminase
MAAFSFHETKNIISGEGGALLLRSQASFERAEIIREKGTDRSRFFRGQVDKYTWVDLGSSFLPGEIIAGFLSAQLDRAEDITRQRLLIWHNYHRAFEELERAGRVVRPHVPGHCQHNGHLYYLLLDSNEDRNRFISLMDAAGIKCVFHYVPLHSSPAGLAHGRVSGSMDVTDEISERLVRLPLWHGILDHQARVIDAAIASLQR